MNVIQIKCQNCNAPVDLDLDQLIGFCPYCGTKLLLEVDELSQLLIEKERTKRAQEYTKQIKEETKRFQEKRKQKIKEDLIGDVELILIIIIMLVVSVGALYVVSKLKN